MVRIWAPRQILPLNVQKVLMTAHSEFYRGGKERGQAAETATKAAQNQCAECHTVCNRAATRVIFLPASLTQSLPRWFRKDSNPGYALPLPATLLWDNPPAAVDSTGAFGQCRCWPRCRFVSVFCFRILALWFSVSSQGHSSTACVVGQVLCHTNANASSLPFSLLTVQTGNLACEDSDSPLRTCQNMLTCCIWELQDCQVQPCQC